MLLRPTSTVIIMALTQSVYEYGILDKEKTGGLELNWGNQAAAMELIHQMARGEGFGVIVGQGVRKMKTYFAENFGADINLLNDIGMESKGLEFSEYMTKESLAQQGGYGFALKGAQHDEAWLIFEDMVRGNLPTFEKKAEALHWFPMWRTSFSLLGLCKLPWNDIIPEDNKDFASGKVRKDGAFVPDDLADPAKIPEHVQNYVAFYTAVTGNEIDSVEYIRMSERVYNFQRALNLMLIPEGITYSEMDTIPYRAMGPVTQEEYLSRENEYYLKQLKNEIGINPEGMSVKEKMASVRKYREEAYDKLKETVYERRGWTKYGVPTVKKMKDLGMNFPEIIEILEKHQ